MKTIQLFTVLVLAFGAFVVSADAQRKKRPVRRTTVKKPVPKPTLTANMILTKTTVANQLSNVNNFVDKLGPIALGIESIDTEAKTKRVSKTALDKNEANKQGVIQAIRGLKTALVKLETDFRTKTDLKKFLVNIQGISDLSTQAEDSALAGKFVASKEPLRTVAKKLSDTLAVMP